LREWLATQGSNYKRATLAEKIGISPRHLNNVLQGKKNLSALAQARAIVVIDLGSHRGSALRLWLKEHGIRIREFAARLGTSPKTVEGWIYRNRMPSESNLRLVFSVTGLPHFRPQTEKDIDRDLEELGPLPVELTAAKKQSERTIASLYRLIQELQLLSTGPRTSRVYFRNKVPGADIGYVRSLLAALLDEEHLEDWCRMTSYRPMLKGQ